MSEIKNFLRWAFTPTNGGAAGFAAGVILSYVIILGVLIFV